MVFTVAWVGMLVVYVIFNFDKVTSLEPNEFGDFLAGAFGPVALFWLVIGYFQQGEELQMQAHELRNAVAQHKDLVHATRDQIAADAEARRADLEAARRIARPLIRAEVYVSDASDHAWDPVVMRWHIRISNSGPHCKYLSAQLRFQDEMISLPVELYSPRTGHWNGLLPLGNNRRPHFIEINCTTERNEKEYQKYFLEPDQDEKWRTTEDPIEVRTNAVRYSAEA